MRAVVDPNILIAALLTPNGAPAQIVSRWLDGEFELVVSEMLLAELERALADPKSRAPITSADTDEFVALLLRRAGVATDPSVAPSRSKDPGDDYLLALAESERAVLVSGDRHVLDLANEFPIRAAREWLEELGKR